MFVNTSYLDDNDPIDLLYLDFEKGFDRVFHMRLLTKLEHLGSRGNLLKWIPVFLSDRFFIVKVGNFKSLERPILSGVPQRSILGPLLFCLYISDLSNLNQAQHVCYTDNCKIREHFFLVGTNKGRVTIKTKRPSRGLSSKASYVGRVYS